MMIGIDLGTTHSLVSFWDGDRAKIIPNALRENLTPSVVSLDDGGDILVGQPAKDRLITHPHLSASLFKRYIGSDKAIVLGQTPFRPEELSALVLKSLKADAEKYLNRSVNEAIISVPAYFNDTQRKTTKVAGRLAGLEVKHLINEPTAAAIAYGLHDKKAFSTFIVLDLGGGTFDVSILEYFPGVMEVHATAGDTFLGGEDFTDAIIECFLEEHHLQSEDLDKKAMHELRRLAEQCKLELSRKSAANIAFNGPARHMDWKITRDKFVAITSDLRRRMQLPIEQSVRDAQLNLKELGAVILVGGATRMPMLRAMVGKMFGKLPYSTLNPDEVVCLGTGIQTGLKTKHRTLKEMVLTDVCPYTLGIEIARYSRNNRLEGGHFFPVIERNATVPLSRVKPVTTLIDNQTTIRIQIFQGESRRTENNIKLSEMEIRIPPAPAGEPKIDIRFSYDANGILEVDVTVANTDIKANLLIEENPGVLSREQIAACLQKLAKLKIHPRDKMANRAILARGERLYEVSLGELRSHIADWLSAFEDVIERQDEQEIATARRLLERRLNEIS
ncbi:MAG: molecular chaperone HscC [Desulfobacteraceae bacterium]|jgi:molecular chaperone HscC